MKAQTFIFSVAAGLTTLVIWEMVKPKLQQQQAQTVDQGNSGFGWWPF